MSRSTRCVPRAGFGVSEFEQVARASEGNEQFPFQRVAVRDVAGVGVAFENAHLGTDRIDDACSGAMIAAGMPNR